jgi:hypothetical protein
MHSAGMSRRQSRFQISDAPIKPVNARTMSQALSKLLKEHGDVDMSRQGRIWALYVKIKRGVIKGGTRAKILRDHCRQFAEWDKCGAFEQWEGLTAAKL